MVDISEELDDIKKSIRATLIASPFRRLTVRELINQYEQLGNDPIPFRKLGYNNVHEFLLSIDTVNVLDRSNPNSLVEPVTTPETIHVARLVNGQRFKHSRIRRLSSACIYPPISRSPTIYSPPHRRIAPVNNGPQTTGSRREIPTEVVCRLVKLLVDIAECSQIGNLFEEYEKLYQEPLQPEELGFSSQEALIKDLERKFVKMNSSPSRDISTNPANAAVDIFPPEVCDPEFEFETDLAVERLEKGDRFNVVLGEVFSLDEFYITFLARADSLNGMMADLNEFYKNNGEKYRIPFSLIVPDLYCAAPFSETSAWHRCRIINFSSTLRQAKVLYFDYGTVELVNVYKLRFLHWTFTKYLPFALLAKLSGIRPINEETYDPYVNKEFLRLYGNCDLEAQVVHKMPHRLEIYLRTLNDEPKKMVHKDLISKRLGRPIDDYSIVEEKKLIISKIGDDILFRITESNETKSKSPSVSPELPQIAHTPFSDVATPTPSASVSSVQQFLPPSSFYNPMLGNYQQPFQLYGPWASAPSRMQNFDSPSPFSTFPYNGLRSPAFIQPHVFSSTPRFQSVIGPNLFYPPSRSAPPVMYTRPFSETSAALAARRRAPLPITPAPAYRRDRDESTSGIVRSDASNPVEPEDNATSLQSIKAEDNATPLQSIKAEDNAASRQSIKAKDNAAPLQSIKAKDNAAPLQSIKEETVSQKLEKVLQKYLDVNESIFKMPSRIKPTPDDSKAYLVPESCDVVDEEMPSLIKPTPDDSEAYLVPENCDVVDEEMPSLIKPIPDDSEAYLVPESNDVVDEGFSDSNTHSPTSLNAFAVEFVPKVKPAINGAKTDAKVVDAAAEFSASPETDLVKKLKTLRAFVLQHATSKERESTM